MTRPSLPLLLVGLSLPLSGCVLVNDYGGFTIADPDAGVNPGQDASVLDASADAGGADGGARDGGRLEDAGPCLSAPDTVYVAERGDDANDGSIDAPLRTIAMALAAARSDTNIASVHVAAGTFDATYESDNEIELVDGVTLRGGYSDDFCIYDPAIYVTEITERFTGGAAIDPVEPPIVGIRGDDLERGVVLEGFRLSMGQEGDDSHIGIRLRNTGAVIRDVVVADGDGRVMTGIAIIGAPSLTMERVTLAMDDAVNTSTGVHLVDVADASLSEIIVERTLAAVGLQTSGIHAEYRTDGAYALRITRSRIHGGRGESGSAGVRFTDARPPGNPAVTVRLTNNLIHGGESGSPVYGIHLTGPSSRTTIYNNTIYTGETEAFAHGIAYDYTFAGPDIRSNVIFSHGPSQFCVQQRGEAWSGTNITLSNNLFFDCPFFLFYDGTNQIEDAEALNALRNVMANQEASEVPLASLTGPDLLTGTMANNDWSFKDGVPCTYTDGAFPAPELTVDYFGNPRDATPSIGAIEFTGTCTP